jgi:hypothetical protein
VTAALIAVWAAGLLLLPGWALWRLAGPRDAPWTLVLPSAFGLSVAVLSLAAWTSYSLRIGLGGLRVIALALVALAVLATVALWRRWLTPPDSGVAPWALWSAVAVAAASALSALYSGVWMSLTADTFYHLAAIRSVLDHGTALPQQVFFSEPVPVPDPTSGAWHSALALVSGLSGADPIDVWRVLTVATAPLTVLAFFALAHTLTRHDAAAVIATALYVVLALNLDFRSAANPNRFGALLGWLALAFVLRFAGSGSWRDLAVAAPLGFAASAVHTAQGTFLLVTLACALAAAVVIRSAEWRRLAVGGAIVGGAALPLLAVSLATVQASAPYAAMALTSPLPLRTGHRPWPWVWPGFWYRNAGTVLGSVFAVLLVRPWWRGGNVRAGLLALLLLAIPAAALTPLFATSYSGQYLLARVADVVQPLAWVAWGWGLVLMAPALRRRTRSMLPAAAVIVVSAVAAASAFYTGPWERFTLPSGPLRSFATTRSTDLTVAWRDRLEAVSRLPRGAVILAAPDVAYELAGLTGKEVVAVPFSHTPRQVEVRDGPRRREDALDAVQGRLDAAGLAGVIEHYGVTDVLVETGSGTEGAALLARAQVLTPIASGPGWNLYAYDPSKLDGFLEVATQEGPGPELARSGIGPSPVIAGRAVFARLQWASAAHGEARLVATGSPGSFSRDVTVGAGPVETLALPVPLDAPVGQYRLALVLPGGRSLALGEFAVGRLLQAEDMGGIVPGDSQGWTTLAGNLYSGGLAALAVHAGATAHQAAAPIPAGDYCIDVGVYDYGTGQANIIEAGLSGGTSLLEWSGSVPQVRELRGRLLLDSASGELLLRVVQRGQPGVIVDRIEVYPAGGASCA